MPRRLALIDSIFHGKSFKISFLGRNDDVVTLSLESLRGKPDRILVIGPGPYELWTVAGQPSLAGSGIPVVGIDLDSRIVKLNRRIKELGVVRTHDIFPIIADEEIFDDRQIRERHQWSNAILSSLDIHGVFLRGDVLEVQQSNRDAVQVLDAESAVDYATRERTGTYSFIFSGNLENNLIFQNGYTFDRAVRYHMGLARILRAAGIYAFTTNEIFFNNAEKGSVRNMTEILEASGFEIMFKATQFAGIFPKNTPPLLSENCGVICAKKNEYEKFPHADKARRAMSNVSDSISGVVTVREGEGTFADFTSTFARGEVNIALVRTGKERYVWLNAVGTYEEVFGVLAGMEHVDYPAGFYPRFFA